MQTGGRLDSRMRCQPGSSPVPRGQGGRGLHFIAINCRRDKAARPAALRWRLVSSRVSSQRHSDSCGVNACVSTYMCLCSHLCRLCRRIAAEPVTADGTGLAVTGAEVAAAAAVGRDGRRHQLQPSTGSWELPPKRRQGAGVPWGWLTAAGTVEGGPACSPGGCPAPHSPSQRGPMSLPYGWSRTAAGQSPTRLGAQTCAALAPCSRMPPAAALRVGLGSRAGGNSSRVRGCCSSSPAPMTAALVQTRKEGTLGWWSWLSAVLPCPSLGLGWHFLPCTAPVRCGLLAGPLAVPKSPWHGAAWGYPGVHAACSEPAVEVLCSVYRFPSPMPGL
ncbi:uncharacterized protein LOC118169600 [Oxyura jamaicensis]|uniref:uncharacterized protein LOC118169600 n=1 Tax=Oxyura jamaicensis TaxID=8884 RepID=UPI0015A708F4|nr:uncharacterized protein LOC118169600 [Oxyura jamaicensis]